MKRIFQGVIEGKTLAKISEELTADRIFTPAAKTAHTAQEDGADGNGVQG